MCAQRQQKRLSSSDSLFSLLGSQRLGYDVRDKERSSYGKDGVKLGESGQNQRLTHYVVTVANGSDTVGADLALIDGSSQVYDTNQNTGTQDSRTLQHRGVSQHTLHHKEADEAVQTLRTRQSRQNHVATEGATILLHCTYGMLLAGCNKQMVDLTYSYEYAIIGLPNGEVVEGKVSSWTDFEEGDQIQVKIDGKTYLVHSSNVVLISN